MLSRITFDPILQDFIQCHMFLVVTKLNSKNLSIKFTHKKHTLAILEFACPSASYQKQPSLTTINKKTHEQE